MWETFTAFGGKLTSSFVNPPLDTQNHFDHNGTRSWIYNWFYGLRTSPTIYGISSGSSDDVVNLLKVFFPEATEAARLDICRISFANMKKRIDPVMVRLGPHVSPIAIADAPNALAYIFAIAIPPTNSSTFENYYLPLAVCYSWTLYVLFLWPTSAANTSTGNVPANVCFVYSTGNSPKFCLGSTWSGANPADAVISGATEAAESELERWSETQIVEPLFKGNTAYPVPPFNPTRHRIAVRRLNEYILGQLDFDKTATPFLASLFSGSFGNIPGLPANIGLPEYVQLVGNIIKVESVQPLATILEPDFLISHTEFGPQLMDYLSALLEALIISNDPTKLLTSFSKVIEFYVTPHVIEPLSKKELPLGQNSKPIVETLAKSLPLLLLVPMQAKGESLRCHLERIHQTNDDRCKEIELRYFIYEVKPYSRSAESFPLYALQ